MANLSERLAKGEEEEEEEEGKGEKGEQKAGGEAMKEHTLRQQLLFGLLDHLETVEEVGGARAIPFMQVELWCVL